VLDQKTVEILYQKRPGDMLRIVSIAKMGERIYELDGRR
jgi:hypothetical protein